MPITDTCYHVPVSPGQMCGCLDLLIWTRMLVELQARRIVELTAALETRRPQRIDIG